MLSNGTALRAADRPILVCVTCHITYEGLAREGLPCAYCLEPIIDLHKEVAKLVPSYDPIKAVMSEHRERAPLVTSRSLSRW